VFWHRGAGRRFAQYRRRRACFTLVA
jgi:hypothetical protein